MSIAIKKRFESRYHDASDSPSGSNASVRETTSSSRRLRLTTIITNIRYEDGASEEQPFSWLTSYSIPKRYTQAAMRCMSDPAPPARLRKLAFDIRAMVESQPLPEYGIRIDRNGRSELVTLYRDQAKPGHLPRGLKLLTVEGGKKP